LAYFFSKLSILGPAIAALRAWRAMQARNMNWRPDTQSLFEDDQDQIARFRKHVIDMDSVFDRVEKRGGPKAPWAVDLSKNSAIFGPYEVTFYRLKTGNFSMAYYRRLDVPPDLTRDMPLLEDAAYCIATAIRKVKATVPALRKVAEYTRTNSRAFVVDGPKPLTASQRAKRQQEIESLADKIDQLTDEVADGRGSYAQLEDILTKLHAQGFFPQMSMISAVAKAM
jgi:hypothetical protein